MDPKNHSPMLLAPGASSSTPVRLPGASSRLPRLDETLLPEDSPYEILDGERILWCLGNEEHAEPHANLAAVLRPLAGPGYRALIELTTRADTVPPPPNFDVNAEKLPKTVQELRPDASILRDGIDPATGDRYLEELSFEVVNEQSMANLRRKAQRLCARGVRRVIAILVKKGQVIEWSPAQSDFIPVFGELRDPCLRLPVSTKALLNAAEAEDSMARSLLAKGNSVLARVRTEERAEGRKAGEVAGLQQGLQQGMQQGLRQGLQRSVQALCELLGIELLADRQARIGQASQAELEALQLHLTRHRAWPAD